MLTKLKLLICPHNVLDCDPIPGLNTVGTLVHHKKAVQDLSLTIDKNLSHQEYWKYLKVCCSVLH